MAEKAPLRERKRQRARDAIVDAAFDLFAERGFADVTVTEIAERAEVGRTTFFRYFGDKQEVVFADEQDLADQLRQWDVEPGGPAPTLEEMIVQARTAVTAMCEIVTEDVERYRLHEKLVAENPELHDRSERKLLHLTDATVEILKAQGAEPQEATLAAHLALACFRAAKATAGADPKKLLPAVEKAFTKLQRIT